MKNIKKLILKSFSFSLITLLSLSFLFPTNLLAFSDISEGNSYYVAITELEEMGLIEGYEDGTFRSNKPINRAETLVLVYRALGMTEFSDLDSTSETQTSFPDVKPEDWFYDIVTFASEHNVVSGFDDGTFKPGNTVKLDEFLKILYEAYEGTPDGNSDYILSDLSTDQWSYPYTSNAASLGIVNVYPSNTMSPNQEMTRGYAAEVIYRYLKQKEGFVFGKTSYYFGRKTASGDFYNKNSLTAAHKTLPFGTIVEVTNLANGKSIEVIINDRGPYISGRVLDLSTRAFSEIESLGAGVANTQFTIISQPEE